MHPFFGLLDYKWDFRVDTYSIYVRFFQRDLSKDNILHPKEPRDYLLNLFFAKPDYEEVHKKIYYASFLGAKIGENFLFFVFLFHITFDL